MKPILLATTIATLVAVAACSRGGNESAASNTAVPGNATGNMVAPSGEVTAAAAYDIRHERYEDMGDALKAIGRELKGDAPDVARIQQGAATLATLAPQMLSWFPAGSGPDVHTKSRAKAEIWSNPDGFRQAHELYVRQIQSFKGVADAGQVEQIRPAAQELGKSCANCHDDFRGPER